MNQFIYIVRWIVFLLATLLAVVFAVDARDGKAFQFAIVCALVAIAWRPWGNT